MRSLPVLLLAAGLALMAVPATAQDTGQTSFTLLSAQDGSNYVWKGPNGETNPTLTVPSGAQITVTIKKGDDPDGIPHNIRVGTSQASEDIMDAGDEITYTFNAPASGSAEYVCVYHATTMKGNVRVAGAGGDAGGDGDNDAPGFALGVVIAGLGIALLLVRRRL